MDYYNLAYQSVKYDAIFSMFYNLPSSGAGLQVVLHRTSSQYRIRTGFSDGSIYNYRDFVIDSPTLGFDHFILVKEAGTPSSTSHPVKLYQNGSEKTNVTGFSQNGSFTSTAWDNTTTGNVFMNGYHKYFVANAALGRNTHQLIADEFAFYNKEIVTNNNGVNEVATIYNSGTPFDYSTLDASYNLTSWFRFGDGANDNISSKQSYDVTGDTSRYFQGNVSDTDVALESLTSSDNIYVPASATWANDYYVTKTSATSNTAISGISSGASITNPLSSSWSYSFWFKSSSDLSGTNITDGNSSNDLILISSQVVYGGYYQGFSLAVRSKTLRVNFTDSASSYYIYGTNDITDTLFNGSWHNLIITHSGTSNSASTWANNCKVYIDNGSVLTSVGAAQSSAPSTSSINPFFGKGALVSTHTSGIQHNYDEIAVWTTTELGSTARQAIYNSGTPADLENTTGVTTPSVYYRFEDGADLGYETISGNNTTNETNIQQVAY